MPQLTRVLTEEDVRRRQPGRNIDFTPYMELLDTVQAQGGVGAQLSLAEGEKQRTEKRRLSLAAKERGLKLTWRKSDAGELRFVLSGEGEPTPGGRPRRRAEEAAAPEPEPEPRNGRRRRRAG